MSTELETVQPVQAMPVAMSDQPQSLTTLSLGQLWKLGKMLVGTGFLPETIRTPEQALAIMTKGQELRVPPMYALSNIVIVKGKPTCSAELMLALIRRDYGPRAIRIAETDEQHCSVEWRQDGWPGIQSYTFTMADAQRAQLSGGNWQKYPAAMLRARCISAVARMAFPECIAGMYVPDELIPDAAISDDGDSDEVLRLERGEQPPAVVGQSAQADSQSTAPAPTPVAQTTQNGTAASWQTPQRACGCPVNQEHACGRPNPKLVGLDDDEPISAHTAAAFDADLDAAVRAQAPAVTTYRFPRNAPGMQEFIKLVEMARPQGLGLDANARKDALGGKSVNKYMTDQGWQDDPAALDRVWTELERRVVATEKAEVAGAE